MSTEPSLSPVLIDLLDRAQLRAIQRRQALCDCEQVLETLLEDQGEPAAAKCVADYLEARPPLPFVPPSAELSRSLRTRALHLARDIAAGESSREILPRHLLTALLATPSPVPGSLRDEVIPRLRPAASPPAGNGNERGGGGPAASRPSAVPAGPAPSKDPGPERFLSSLGPHDEDAYLVDRPELVDGALRTLLFGSALLVGPPGSGRRSLVRLLVRRRDLGELPEGLRQTRFLELDPVRLIAGTSYRGELEERVQKALDSLTGDEEPPVVVIENLHLLSGAGSNGGIDVSAALVPRLKNGEIRLLAFTTQDDLRERLEKNPPLLDQLTPIHLPAPDSGEIRRLLDGLASRIRNRLGVEIAPAALDLSVRAGEEYVPHVAPPGAEAKIVWAAAARLAYETRMLSAADGRRDLPYWNTVGNPPPEGPPTVGERHVLLALSELHRIPFEHLDSGVREKIRGLDAAFHAHIFGQDQVLPVVSKTVKVALMNVAHRHRPRGSFFFLGPPGTGKTECARLLARYLMGSESALLRLDMSEFQESAAASSLIGSDKGLVGSEEGGRLTEPLRVNPHRVVLLDEIEKAHPKVFDLFLQILDNGEIHDKRSCLVSFRHALVIFTSNAGCSAEFDLEHAERDEIVKRLGSVFRPEFLDRIQDFVPFTALSHEARGQVVRFQLTAFAEQLRRTHGLELQWNEDLVELGSALSEGEPGVRNVLRWVQGVIKPLAVDALLDLGQAPPSGSRLLLEAVDGRPEARVAVPGPEEAPS